jgi:peptidoglycan/LPS O-acetylase OafA/YrhL
MPSIAEVTGGSRVRRRRRLALGVGLVLMGAFLTGLGAAGAVSGSALRTGLLVGGLAILASLWWFALRTPLRERERSMAIAGTTAATASLLGLWILAPASVLPQSVLVLAIGLVYAIGVTVLMAAVFAGLTLPERGPRRDSMSGAVSWTRSDAGTNTDRQAADGGATDDDLSYPLEEK